MSFFRPKDAIIDAHNTEPILNQNKQTNLTRYVSLSRVPLLPYTVAYGNSIPEETNARFGRLWKFVLPKVRSSHRRRFVASTSCHPLIFFSRNFVKFVKCVYSRGPCVRGVCGSAGGAEGRESMGVLNNCLLVADKACGFSFSFLFLPDVFSSK